MPAFTKCFFKIAFPKYAPITPPTMPKTMTTGSIQLAVRPIMALMYSSVPPLLLYASKKVSLIIHIGSMEPITHSVNTQYPSTVCFQLLYSPALKIKSARKPNTIPNGIEIQLCPIRKQRTLTSVPIIVAAPNFPVFVRNSMNGIPPSIPRTSGIITAKIGI